MLNRVQKAIGWILAIVLTFFLVGLLAFQTYLLLSLISHEGGGVTTSFQGDRIGVLSLTGPIFSIDRTLHLLRRYEENSSVKALLLEVDSPGGSVGPSQELSQAIARFSEGGRPVIASIRTVGASGGYYVASSADTIVANPGSLVGSIGVIMQFMNVNELAEKIGVDYEVVKSGKFKDLGSPFRDMTAEEQEVLRGVIMDVYDQFLTHILEQREQLTRAELEAIADGRVLTGRQALERQLIDELGSRQQAIEIATRAAGMEEPRLLDYGNQGVSVFQRAESLLASFSGYVQPSGSQMKLLYMMPGGSGWYE